MDISNMIIIVELIALIAMIFSALTIGVIVMIIKILNGCEND